MTTRGRRYFPIHCFPGIPFRKSAKVKNILQPVTGYESESEINHKAVQLQMSHQKAQKKNYEKNNELLIKIKNFLNRIKNDILL